MQGALKAFSSHGNFVKNAVLRQVRVVNPLIQPAVFSRFESAASARIEEHGFESTRIADVLNSKGKGADGSWLYSVYDVVKSMTQHNVGALVVVKPGEQKSIAGIITERGTFTSRLLCLIYWIYNTLLFLLEIMTRRWRTRSFSITLVAHSLHDVIFCLSNIN